MRSLVREILNPVLAKNEEEKERYQEITKKTTDVLSRLEIVEYSFFNNRKNQKQPNLFDSIFQKINEISRYYDSFEKRLSDIFDDLQNFKTLISQHISTNSESFMNQLKLQNEGIQKVSNRVLKGKGKIQSIDEQNQDLSLKLDNLRDELSQQKEQLNSLDNSKLSLTKYYEFLDGLEKSLINLDEVSSSHQNKLITIENYIEKYIPVKIQTIVMDNIRLFVNKETINKLKGQENKVYQEITEQLLNDEGRGSVLQNILKINMEISKRTSQKIDLTLLQKHQTPYFKYSSIQESVNALKIQQQSSARFANNQLAPSDILNSHSATNKNEESFSQMLTGNNDQINTQRMNQLNSSVMMEDQNYINQFSSRMRDNQNSNSSRIKHKPSKLSNSPLIQNKIDNTNIEQQQQADMQFMQNETETISDKDSVQSETSVKLTKLKDEISDIRIYLKEDIETFKAQILQKLSEQQVYIKILHEDFENVEKRRMKNIQEEEASKCKIMEDIVKLYTKTKDYGQIHTMLEKKIGLINDKLARVRQIAENGGKMNQNTQLSNLNHDNQILSQDRREHSVILSQTSQNEYFNFTDNACLLDRRKKRQQHHKNFSSVRPSLSIINGERSLTATPIGMIFGGRSQIQTPQSIMNDLDKIKILDKNGIARGGGQLLQEKNEQKSQNYQQINIKLQSLNLDNSKDYGKPSQNDISEYGNAKIQSASSTNSKKPLGPQRYFKQNSQNQEIESSEYKISPSSLSMIQPTLNSNFHI
eukprot:403373643